MAFLKFQNKARKHKARKHKASTVLATHSKTPFGGMLRPWLAASNGSLDSYSGGSGWQPFLEQPLMSCRQLLYSSALGEIAVRDNDRISFWRMGHGGKVIKFVARIKCQGGRSACYAGTCLFLFRWTGREKALTMMCRHDRALQDFYSVRVPQVMCDVEGYGDVFALLSGAGRGHATVYQQRAVREFVVLFKILPERWLDVSIPTVCFIPGWQTTICDGWRRWWHDGSHKSVFVLHIYRTWSSTSAFDTFRSREHVKEFPVENDVFYASRRVVWVHDCMGVLSVLDVGKEDAPWRPCFMFSCDPDQYAFTRNVSDVKQAWMGACA